MKKSIIGSEGFVGKAQKNLFSDAICYDEPLKIGTKEDVNTTDIAFICVPTPMKDDKSCDISIVEDVLKWLKVPLIVILSTIPPGTTDKLTQKYGKNIVFQPEYIGETVEHPLLDKKSRNFVILGGLSSEVDKVIDCYKEVYNSTVKIMKCSSIEAETIKYMENSFIGTYVTFCNEFFEICKNLGIDYNKIREGFLLDPRMTPFWTFIYQNNRGFDGKCIPKDMNAIVKASEKEGYLPQFLQDVIKNNERIKNG